MNHRYVVRVCTNGVGSFDKACENSPILEVLRYAGMVAIHRNDEGMCFDILPPGLNGEQSKVWARMNAENMQSHGINAVCAPEFRAGDASIKFGE